MIMASETGFGMKDCLLLLFFKVGMILKQVDTKSRKIFTHKLLKV